MKQVLPKNYRLKRKKDFEKVIKKGKHLRENFLILKTFKNNLKLSRIGFAVGQRVSKKAVVRNKIKRRLREAARIYITKIKPGYDLVFLTEKGIEEKGFLEIKKTIKSLFLKVKLFKENE